MSKLLFVVSTVAMSLILTFAPVFAQDAATVPTDDGVRPTVATDDDNRPDFGWLGLLGLVGLGGLMRRDREARRHDDRTVNR